MYLCFNSNSLIFYSSYLSGQACQIMTYKKIKNLDVCWFTVYKIISKLIPEKNEYSYQDVRFERSSPLMYLVRVVQPFENTFLQFTKDQTSAVYSVTMHREQLYRVMLYRPAFYSRHHTHSIPKIFSIINLQRRCAYNVHAK